MSLPFGQGPSFPVDHIPPFSVILDTEAKHQMPSSPLNYLKEFIWHLEAIKFATLKIGKHALAIT